MKTSRIIIALFLLVISVQKAFGTAQIPDYLIYKGDTLAIYANPLESYFDNHVRPDSIFYKYGYNSTACWRGYIAYWELKNDSLFLTKIQGGSSTIDLSLLFKHIGPEKKIFANWVSSSILNPYGELLHYEHMGYGSIYEHEREFSFSKGILTGMKEYDNSKTKHSKYTQNQELLRNFIKSNTNNSLLPDSVDRARVFIQIKSVTAEGKIDSVSVVRGYNEILEKEAIRVVKSIPEWDVLYSHGEIYNQQWLIPIIFEK